MDKLKISELVEKLILLSKQVEGASMNSLLTSVIISLIKDDEGRFNEAMKILEGVRSQWQKEVK